MKKILLACIVFSAIGFTKVNAQILNAGFESLGTQTAYFDGFSGFFKPDTFTFNEPVDWTTTNAISGADTFGSKFFITQTATAHTGNSAIELTTDTLKTVGPPLGPRRLTIPGLALNGHFELDIQGNVLTGGVISPEAVPGAGQPWTKRLAAVKGFYSYAPVFNDSLGHIDSCIVWAVLRKGDTLVASAQFVSGKVTTGYEAFSANFNYVSCAQPDTLVILLAASIPNFASVLTGSTKLVAGSILRVDDLDVDTLPNSYAYPPIARRDVATTNKNVAVSVLVKANDDDCDGTVAALTLALVTQATQGTAALVGNTHFTYTPNNNYIGRDSFVYSINDGAFTASAKAVITINNVSGINEAGNVKVVLFPVPASNELNVQFENQGKATLRVFDMVGNIVNTTIMTKTNGTINTESLSNGVYGIQILDETNTVIARTKFTVSK